MVVKGRLVQGESAAQAAGIEVDVDVPALQMAMEVLQRENAELRASKVPRSTSKVIENPSTSSMGISRPAAGCFNDLFVGSGGRLPHLARASTPYTNGLEKLATHLGLYLGPQLNDFPEPDDASA